MLVEEVYRRELETSTGLQIHLRFNENSQTLLSVKRGGGQVRVSLHKMFIEAPKNIWAAISQHIIERSKKTKAVLWRYILDKFPQLNYANRLDLKSLAVKGNVHDLKEIFAELNSRYFDDHLQLHITWFGKSVKNRKTLNLGLYQDPLRLIKIHKILDQVEIPRFFVAYVIYHEMLHHVCPAYVDCRGRNRIHHPEFVAREKSYHDYEKSKNWLKKNKMILFESKVLQEIKNGWS